MTNTILQVWLARWDTPDNGPQLMQVVHTAEDGPAALFSAGAVVRRTLVEGQAGLHATNALVGGMEGVLVYALQGAWAAFVPRLRLRGGEVAHPAFGAPQGAVEAVC